MGESGLSIFCVSLDGMLLAVYGLSDTIRDDSTAIIAELERRGKNVYMLSGDTPAAVQHVASSVGIPPSRAIASCLPATKGEFIRTLQTEHIHRRRILFVGDGTNDAVAINMADCGVAVANATEVAVSSASVVLLRAQLRALLVLFDIAESAHKRIVINFAWCFVYNTLAILLASGAAVNVRISPQWAGLGELVSIFPLIIVGIHLGRKKFG
jgi:Cd2+-exporting ATPase